MTSNHLLIGFVLVAVFCGLQPPKNTGSMHEKEENTPLLCTLHHCGSLWEPVPLLWRADKAGMIRCMGNPCQSISSRHSVRAATTTTALDRYDQCHASFVRPLINRASLQHRYFRPFWTVALIWGSIQAVLVITQFRNCNLTKYPP